MTARDALRVLKGTLRDAQARGDLMTITDLADATGIGEDRIWGFITDGEIDTASFNDPQVRDFVFKRRREMLKQNMPAHEERAEPHEHHGFHHRTDEDDRRR
jgi:hypothetical protein